MGFILQTQAAEKSQGSVSEGGQIAGRFAGVETAGIFTERHISEEEAWVLDAPMIAAVLRFRSSCRFVCLAHGSWAKTNHSTTTASYLSCIALGQHLAEPSLLQRSP